MPTIEEYNYRVALKDALQKRIELEAAIAARKKELHAVEKRIVEMNRQYAEGDYTGELFSQAESEPKKDEQPNKPLEREDGLTHNIFMKMVNREMEDYLCDDLTYQNFYQGIFHRQVAAVLDFVKNNPNSATALNIFHNKGVVEKDDDGCSWEIWPARFCCTDDNSKEELMPKIVAEDDHPAVKDFIEKWTKIMKERKDKIDAESAANKKSKKKRK